MATISQGRHWRFSTKPQHWASSVEAVEPAHATGLKEQVIMQTMCSKRRAVVFDIDSCYAIIDIDIDIQTSCAPIY